MDDALLVSRAMAGDLDSFGRLYDSYFGGVYDFAWRVLRDSDEAVDAAQEAFLEATHGLAGIAKATSFKPWLFTIAHRIVVTRADRGRGAAPLASPIHEEAFGSFDVPDACRLDDPGLAVGDGEAAALVWEAATALNTRDYALLDLHLRQGLDSVEIAAVMGVSKGNARTLANRLKAAAGGVIGGYIVARRGSSDCEKLQQVLAAFEFPPYTDPLRNAVDAHINGCETCQASKTKVAAPLEILAGFTPVAAAPGVKGDIWGRVAAAWATGRPSSGGSRDSGGGRGRAGAPLPPNPYSAAIGSGGGGGLAGGFAPSSAGGGDGWNRNRILLFVGAVIGLLVFAFGAGALLLAAFGGDDGGVASGAPTATRTPAPARTSTPGRTVTVGVSVETPTPNLTPSATPEPTETPTELPPTETPTTAPTATRTPRTTPTPRVSPTREPTRTPRGQQTATPTPCEPTDPSCPAE